MTPAITEEKLLDTLRARCSVKQFDSGRKIPAKTWAALEESLVLTQSAFGAQPWKFLVIDTPELRRKLRPVSWDQAAVTDADKFVVFLLRRQTNAEDVAHYIARMSEVRKLPAESLQPFQTMIAETVKRLTRSRKVREWAALQLYIALGQFTTAAALLGVDTCPLGGIEPENYDEILKLAKTPFTTGFAIAAGYALPTDPYVALPKVRFPLAEVVEHR